MALAGRFVRRFAQVSAAVGISVVLGWYVWSKVNTHLLATTLAALSPGMLAALVFVYMLYQILRAWRFSIIFPSAEKDFAGLVATMCVQGGIAVMLPGLGEAVIIGFLWQRHRVHLGVAAAGIVLASLIDLVLHLALFAAALAVYRELIPGEVLYYAALLMVVSVVIILLAAVALAAPRRLAARLRGWASEYATLAANAVSEMLRRHVLMPFVLTSIFMWTMMFVFFRLMLAALLVSGGWNATFFIYSLLLPVRAIPIRGIADFGTHEASWYFLLRLLGQGSEQAATTAFGSHALSLLAVAATSIIGLAWIGLERLQAKTWL